MVAKTESSIWDRIIEQSWEDLEPQGAQAILRLKFRQSDVDRMNELAALARDGNLSEEEASELDEYTRIGRMIAVLQAKARLALRRPRRS